MATKKITKTATKSPIADEIFNESEEMIEEVVEAVVPEKKVVKQPRKYESTDLIPCRSVTPGWLACYGKSGQPYIFYNIGDECEIEYGDLYALKNARSSYLYDPLFIIEDEELLENPRWKDLAEFYSEKVYGLDDIDQILNIPNNKFKSTLQQLPKGLLKAMTVEVAKRIENGTFDSVKKVKVIDDICGTDFWTMMAGVDN